MALRSSRRRPPRPPPGGWFGKPITSSGEVEIYEELVKDADGGFTTSFIRQDHHFKDNRLLPLGWRKWGPDLKELSGRRSRGPGAS